MANTAMRLWDRVAHGLTFDLVLSPGINCLDADFVIVHALFHRLRELAREEQNPQSNQQSRGTGMLRQLHRRAYYATVATLERIVYANRKTHLAAVSQRTADLLGHYFGRDDVAVIFNGIDTVQFSLPARLARRQGARFRRKFSDSEFVLLLIGNDWRAKGLPAVLEAMAAVSGLPLRLIVVGADTAENFQRMAQRLKIADRCQWESPRADVIEFYAAADVYVSPSKEDSFGLPVAEAMACGLPVISSKFAGVSELIQNERDGLILSDPTNAGMLADLLRGLYANAAAQSSLGNAAAVTAQNWTWDRNATAMWQWLQARQPYSITRSVSSQSNCVRHLLPVDIEHGLYGVWRPCAAFTIAHHCQSYSERCCPIPLSTAFRVASIVNARDSCGMLVTKGFTIHARPVGISRVNEITSLCT